MTETDLIRLVWQVPAVLILLSAVSIAMGALFGWLQRRENERAVDQFFNECISRRQHNRDLEAARDRAVLRYERRRHEQEPPEAA